MNKVWSRIFLENSFCKPEITYSKLHLFRQEYTVIINNKINSHFDNTKCQNSLLKLQRKKMAVSHYTNEQPRRLQLSTADCKLWSGRRSNYQISVVLAWAYLWETAGRIRLQSTTLMTIRSSLTIFFHKLRRELRNRPPKDLSRLLVLI